MFPSDDLFNDREKMFFEVVLNHGVSAHRSHRWAVIREMFRREMVNSVPRGLMRDGVDKDLSGYADETLDVGTASHPARKER